MDITVNLPDETNVVLKVCFILLIWGRDSKNIFILNVMAEYIIYIYIFFLLFIVNNFYVSFVMFLIGIFN